jgi:head-tail adaptor
MSGPVLNRPLVLEERVEVGDGAGGLTTSWTALGTLWAEVDARSGREGRLGGAVVARASFRITVRGAAVGAASRPRPDQRFRDGVRVFRILAVTEADAGARFLTCFAQEEVAA